MHENLCISISEINKFTHVSLMIRWGMHILYIWKQNIEILHLRYFVHAYIDTCTLLQHRATRVMVGAQWLGKATVTQLLHKVLVPCVSPHEIRSSLCLLMAQHLAVLGHQQALWWWHIILCGGRKTYEHVAVHWQQKQCQLCVNCFKSPSMIISKVPFGC